jgi:hypothetical protein
MNWRDIWDPNTQYYLNDVVTSSQNISTYILVGRTTLLGGADPSLNAEWTKLSTATTGVQEVAVTTPGLTLTGTDTLPIINNTGVISVQLASGSGLQNIGTSISPVLRNTGVLALTAGPGITITGTQANYTISSPPPPRPIMATFTSTSGVTFIPVPTGQPNAYQLTPTGPAFSTTIANPASYPGIWCFDLTGISFFIIPVSYPNNSPPFTYYFEISIGVSNGVTAAYAVVPAAQGGQLRLPYQEDPANPVFTPYVITAGSIWVPISFFTALGTATPVNNITIRITPYLSAGATYYPCSSPSAVTAIYYPDGIE